MYISKEDRVFYNNEYVCTVSPPNREIDETMLEGESWADMYSRTEPLRENNKNVAKEIVSFIAKALNEGMPL